VAGKPMADANCLIIDNVGMLSRLYYYAYIAYVGGGFGEDGIHNILEAAVFGKPVVFGPIYDKYIEADELIAEGGAISISNALELEEVFNRLFNHETEYKWRSDVAEKFVEIKAGATQKIFDYIQANRLLTN
jgi:3-deoxy-D-manno-octulosonic-acid transferase